MMLFGDLHIHSVVSDGSLHPSDIVRISRRKSLQIISVTDHNTFLGSLIASKYVDKKNQILLYGAEVRTHLGDVLLLCPHPIAIVNNLPQILDLCRDNNCLLVPAHPYDVLRLGVGSGVTLKLWDAVEVFNASSDLISNIITYVLTRNAEVPQLSNSDAHVGELIGASYNIIYADSFDVDTVLDSIRKGEVVPVMKYSIVGSISRVVWSLKKYVNGYKLDNIVRLNEKLGSATPLPSTEPVGKCK